MKSFGALYVTTVKYPKRFIYPFFEIGWTQEIEEPFRYGKCLVLRLPYGKVGLGIGIWLKQKDEDDALLGAIQGREVALDDIEFV
jgi:hypothetical protein